MCENAAANASDSYFTCIKHGRYLHLRVTHGLVMMPPQTNSDCFEVRGMTKGCVCCS